MSIAELDFKEGMPRRIDPSPLIAKIIEHADSITDQTINPFTPITNEIRSLLSKTHTKLSKDEARALYNKGKLERISYLSILDAFTVDTFIDFKKTDPPFGLVDEPSDEDGHKLPIEEFTDTVKVDSFSPYTVFEELQRAAITTLGCAYATTIDQFKEGEYDNLGITTINGLQTWQDFYNKFMPKTKSGHIDLVENPIGYLEQPFREYNFVGVITGVRTMTSAIQVLPIVGYRECGDLGLNPDILGTIASNSYSTIARLAVLDHHRLFGPEIVLFKGKETDEFIPFDHNDFKYQADKSGVVSLTITDGVWEKAKMFLQNIKKVTGETMTTGCPIVARVDGEVAGEQLWDWFVEMAVEIYKKQFRLQDSRI